MNVKDISIKTLLIKGFFALLIIIINSGRIACNPNKKLGQSSEKLHNHSFPVIHKANLQQNAVFLIHRDLNGHFLSTSQTEYLDAPAPVEAYQAEAEEQLQLIQHQYRGFPQHLAIRPITAGIAASSGDIILLRGSNARAPKPIDNKFLFQKQKSAIHA